jgi:hypothetical protein
LCGDKAYLSRKICNLIAKCGGEPFISIKKNMVKVRSKGSKAWKEMLFLLYRCSKKLYLKEGISKKESCRNSCLHSQAKLQSFPVLKEEEGAKERNQPEGADIQPFNHSEAACSI